MGNGNTTRSKVRTRALVAMAGTGMLFTLGAAPAAAIDRVDVVDGGASGLDVTIVTPIAPIVIPPTPAVQIPTGGGSANDSAVNVGQPGAAQVDVLDVTTSGTGAGTPAGAATSSAHAAGVDVGGGGITADVLSSECRANGKGASGSSNIIGGSAGGSQFPDGAAPPNSGGAIPGVGSLTINKQDAKTSSTSNSMNVSALDITLDNPLAQGSVGVARSNCLAAGVTTTGATTPGGAGTPDDGSTPGRSLDDDPSAITGLLARTGPFALGPLMVAALALLAGGALLRRFGGRTADAAI